MASTILMSEAQDGGFGFWLIAMLASGGWGFAGRWIVLHPDKIFPNGLFASRDSFGARVGRFESSLVGTFMAFSGATGVVFYLALIVHLPSWIGIPAAIACGIYAAIHVRKELRQHTAETDQHVQSS